MIAVFGSGYSLDITDYSIEKTYGVNEEIITILTLRKRGNFTAQKIETVSNMIYAETEKTIAISLNETVFENLLFEKIDSINYRMATEIPVGNLNIKFKL